MAPDYEEHDTLDTVLVSPALHDDSERTMEHACRRHAIVPMCDDLSQDVTPPPRSSDAYIEPKAAPRSARSRAASFVATVSLAGATAFGISSHRRPSEAPPPSHVTTAPRAVTLAPPAYSAAPAAHAEPVAPAATCATPVSPVTATGRLRRVEVPSPHWPSSFLPQHRTVPSASSARVKS